MGKLFEAIERKKDADRNAGGVGRESVTPEHIEDGLTPRRFEFTEFSLNAAALPPGTPRLVDATVQAESTDSLTTSVRRVSIDVTRVASHLGDFLGNRCTAEYFKLAALVKNALGSWSSRRILIASARHAEGRTCVCMNLAAALARLNRRVLVVDADFKSGDAHLALGLEALPGVVEVLSRTVSLSSAVIGVNPGGFDFLPAGKSGAGPAEVYASPAFSELMDLLEVEYDIILFDSAPLLEGGDTELLAGLVGTTVLVVAAGRTETADLDRVGRLLGTKPVAGVVLNRSVGRGNAVRAQEPKARTGKARRLARG